MMPAAFAHTLSWFVTHFADLSRLTSTALIAAIWQGALLAGIAGLGMKFAPRIPAAARFAVWFSVFTLIAALPLLSFAPHAAAARSAASHSAWLNLDTRWTLAITLVWAVASLFRAATLIAAALRVRTLARRATPIAHNLLAPAVSSRRAQVCSSDDVDRPTVIGFFSPKILLPAWLLDKLTPAEFDQIVLHESTHLNRADDWFNLLQKLALVLFPLNPALAWVERRLCFERELACDERVLSFLAARADRTDRSATDYAACLANLAGYRLERRNLIGNLALALGALGSSVRTSARESELGRRVARILRPVARMKPLHARLAVSVAIAALLFAATELERSPQLIAFNSPAQSAQIADLSAPAAAPQMDFAPGYRAIPARLTLPAAPQPKSLGDAAPHVSAVHSSSSALVAVVALAQPHALDVRAKRPDSSVSAVTPHIVAARQIDSERNLVITRWTVFQSAGGYRVVRTSAVFSEPQAPRSTTEPGAPPKLRLGGMEDPALDSATQAPVSAPRIRDISQPIPPYAAVPVPGGWLVFQL